MRWVTLLVLAACQPGLTEADPLPALDFPQFRCVVQPILVKSCGMLACHGTTDRYFQVYGRNRLRVSDDEDERASFLTEDELAMDYSAALAFVDASDSEESLLLRKPLDEAAGGAFHRGAEIFGQGDVWLDPEEDHDYGAVLGWIDGDTGDPDCIAPGADQ